ncbi:amidohydrolase family protein [Paludibaculum fermentans]|uniref:amidohydrolase family protein n=1 Tax=Paludibaculum fermentans TaxID=1473598 RepID=UPI003EC0F253
MWRSGFALLAAALAANPQTPPAQAAVPRSAAVIAITGVTVIDVSNGAHHARTGVLIQGDRITAVGRRLKVPRGATRVDGRGQFLIPGLWDMHAHHQGTGAEAVELFVAKGVVGTRDMGADADFIFPLRERIRSGAVLGPEIVLAGPMLDDAPASYPYRRPTKNAAEARIAVPALKNLGVDFIKVHDHTPRDVFFAIAEEAPKVGLTFAGHVPSAVSVEEAADAGMRSIEHLANYRVFGDCGTGATVETFDVSSCAKLFDKLAAKGVWQTPTLAFMLTLPAVFSGAPLAHSEYASDSLLKLTSDNVKFSHLDAKTLDKLRQAGIFTPRAIRELRSHGNRFLAGCDGLVPGFCLHDELEWMTKSGFSPLEALQTATLNPAIFLGRAAVQGGIGVGQRSDVVLLDADPTVDIRNITKIAAVIVRGKLVDRSALDRIVANHLRHTR